MYNSVRHIAARAVIDPPHEGVGVHLAAGGVGRLPFLVRQHQYTVDSNYRANRAESVLAPPPTGEMNQTRQGSVIDTSGDSLLKMLPRTVMNIDLADSYETRLAEKCAACYIIQTVHYHQRALPMPAPTGCRRSR